MADENGAALQQVRGAEAAGAPRASASSRKAEGGGSEREQRGGAAGASGPPAPPRLEREKERERDRDKERERCVDCLAGTPSSPSFPPSPQTLRPAPKP